MRKAFLTFLALLITVGLSACGGDGGDPVPDPGEVAGGDAGSVTEPSDDFAQVEIEAIDMVKRLSTEYGMPYNFDLMEPVIEDDGDSYIVYFTYINPNAFGGGPEALVSKNTGEIISLEFTQ